MTVFPVEEQRRRGGMIPLVRNLASLAGSPRLRHRRHHRSHRGFGDRLGFARVRPSRNRMAAWILASPDGRRSCARPAKGWTRVRLLARAQWSESGYRLPYRSNPATAAAIQTGKRACESRRLPLTSPRQKGRAAALEACPTPDILVNNAGGPPPGDFHDWTREDWIKAIDANMLTPIELIKATVDGMVMGARLRPDRQHHVERRSGSARSG